MPKFRSMATIEMIRLSDGRTLYPCGLTERMPTNPKAGTPTSGNTLNWNGRTRQTTLLVPRQNPVNIDSWSPQSGLRYTGQPAVYSKPQPLRAAADASATARRTPIASPCPVVPPKGQSLCEK